MQENRIYINAQWCREEKNVNKSVTCERLVRFNRNLTQLNSLSFDSANFGKGTPHIPQGRN